MTLRIGSLFTGSGQLDRAVEVATGGRVVWHCETDRAAAKLLDYRYPDVPNLGDVRRVNWSAVRWGNGPVDVLCGGFPCVDISAAGLRAGMGPGTQSGLWSEFIRAIDNLRPSLVIIENVRNLLHVAANRHLESDPWSVGEAVVLTGMGAVLGDLADLGYDAEWEALPASDVGAPHRRQRIFIAAHPGRQ